MIEGMFKLVKIIYTDTTIKTAKLNRVKEKGLQNVERSKFK